MAIIVEADGTVTDLDTGIEASEFDYPGGETTNLFELCAEGDLLKC